MGANQPADVMDATPFSNREIRDGNAAVRSRSRVSSVKAALCTVMATA